MNICTSLPLLQEHNAKCEPLLSGGLDYFDETSDHYTRSMTALPLREFSTQPDRT
jgi:hypothetical protein